MTTNLQETLQASLVDYLAIPTSAPRGSLIVLHAWWGLNNFIRSFCNRLAGEGFLVLAPDLYHGETANTIEEAQKLRSKLSRKVVEAELIQAMALLQARPDLARHSFGGIGFSLGAYWLLWLAEQLSVRLTASVLFYGARNGDYSRSSSAFLGHFAEQDDYVSAASVKKLQKALVSSGKQVSFHTYPGTSHWFFESDRPDAYRAGAADLAWQRTVSFLQSHLLISE